MNNFTAPDILEQIRIIVCDVDGVLSDGKLYYGNDGIEIKNFNVKDGLGIRMAVDFGMPVIFLTGRRSAAVTNRAKELGATLYDGVQNKEAAILEIADGFHIRTSNIAYIGDDINDLLAMKQVGFPVAVNDATSEIKKISAYITTLKGGEGAVREVIEHIFRAQGVLKDAITSFIQKLSQAGDNENTGDEKISNQ